jgi:putative NADPH-quinone reductase
MPFKNKGIKYYFPTFNPCLFKGKYSMLVTIIGAPKKMYFEGGAHEELNKHLEH